MGSEEFYPDEGPVREIDVEAFRIERHPVTNRQFAAFVEATDYVTVAERQPDPDDFPGADPSMLVPGGLVFTPTSGPVPLTDWSRWWRWQPGASWRHPEGPGSDVVGREDHPVVLVSFDDAGAYARWAGRELPTEVEFEYASLGGATAAPYAWGAERAPEGQVMANTWQGRFPYRNEGARGWVGTSLTGSSDRLGMRRSFRQRPRGGAGRSTLSPGSRVSMGIRMRPHEPLALPRRGR